MTVLAKGWCCHVSKHVGMLIPSCSRSASVNRASGVVQLRANLLHGSEQQQRLSSKPHCVFPGKLHAFVCVCVPAIVCTVVGLPIPFKVGIPEHATTVRPPNAHGLCAGLPKPELQAGKKYHGRASSGEAADLKNACGSVSVSSPSAGDVVVGAMGSIPV